jgi:hypothetical protein
MIPDLATAAIENRNLVVEPLRASSSADRIPTTAAGRSSG